MPFSTESSLPYTWSIEDISPTMIAGMLNVSPEAAVEHRRQSATRHRDPGWVDETLARLSPPALCTIAALVARGGMLHVPDLDTTVERMFGLSPEEVDAGVNELLPLLLIAPLTSPRGNALALVTPSADLLAERVSGIELVPLTGELVPNADADDGRALVAVTMALATAELKLTQSNVPHRARLKHLAKQLGVEADRLELLIMMAFEVGLLRCDEDGTLMPDRELVIAACDGRYPNAPGLDELVAALADGQPVALDTVRSWTLGRGFGVSTSLVGLLPGFRAGTVARSTARACPEPAALPNGSAGPSTQHAETSQPAVMVVRPGGVVAASVTPSFEVYVPPESHPRHLVDVLGACELVRIDRAIVARITKASIMSAIARGATCDELLAALTGALRTPLPQNVAAAIRDWTGSTVTAVVTSGRVIVVPPADQARVVAALSFADPTVVAPGVVLVPEDESERRIVAALRKLGILERAPVTAPPAKRARASADRRVDGAPAAAGLRSRVAAYCASTTSERAPLIARLIAPSLHRKKSSGVPARSVPLPAVDETSALAIRLDQWENEHHEPLDPDAFEALCVVLATVSSPERLFVFGAATLAELGTRVVNVLTAERVARLDPDVVEALEDGLEFRLARATSLAELDWQRDHLVARLEAAARTHSTLILEHRGRPRTVAVSRIAQRGATLMVLGEDETGQGIAIRITEIGAIAEPTSSTSRWHPAPGMNPPAGHVRCPCGSGERYRDCCRTDPARA